MVSHTVCSIWVWNIIGIICISLHSNSSAQVKGGRIRGEKYPFMPAVLISGDETLSCFLPRPIRCATDLLIPRAMPLRHATCCLEASPSPPLARSLFLDKWRQTSPLPSPTQLLFIFPELCPPLLFSELLLKTLLTKKMCDLNSFFFNFFF